jgi:hypothetical protein
MQPLHDRNGGPPPRIALEQGAERVSEAAGDREVGRAAEPGGRERERKGGRGRTGGERKKSKKGWNPRLGGEDGGPSGMEVEMRNLEGYVKWRLI